MGGGCEARGLFARRFCAIVLRDRFPRPVLYAAYLPRHRAA
jgi:hypothetical protein